MSLPSSFDFGDVHIDAASELVSRSGESVLLEPKAFELLVYLVEHRGRLIEKQELLDALWPDTFVSDNAMTRVVAQLRKALGDDAHEPRYIETVPRRGYRFIANVRHVRGKSETPQPGWNKTWTLLGLALVAVFAAGVALVHRGHIEDEARLDTFLQVTSSGALDTFPTIAPDGNAIAFSSNRDGSFEIYVRQLAPGGALIQLTADGNQNFEPAWSPKGDLIAYSSKNRGGIWIAPAFGGTTRMLTELGGSPAWSPDGRSIVFQSESLNDLGVNAVTLPPSTLWIRDLDDGSARPLTTVGEPPGGHGRPAWSPTGRRIAFVASDINLSKIWTVTLAGELELVAEPALRVYDLVYSPSGDELYYTGHGGETFDLWVLDLERVGSEPRLVMREHSPAIRYPSLSADGSKIAYAGLVTVSNLASIALTPDTYEPVGTPRQLTHYTNHRNYFPRFSPDGHTLAFERFVAGAASDVWLIDADGRNERRLTILPSHQGLPWWSADGGSVIFSARREGEGSGFWAIDIDSGNQTFLRSRPSHWSIADLSRDGKWIAFNSRNNDRVVNIWVASMTEENGNERQLTFDDEMMGYPAWSPDGELIAFEIKRGSDTHVGVIPSRGGTPIQLTNEPGESWTGSWSPDGDKIAFAAWRDDVWNLRWVSRTDRSECQLTDYTSLHTFVRYPTWSSRGDQIVYEYAETTGDIWMLELPSSP